MKNNFRYQVSGIRYQVFKGLEPGTRNLEPGTWQTGFTLVELLVSMTILGILTTLGLGNYLNSQMKARDVQRKSDLAQVGRALELYYGDKGRYPRSDAGGRILACPSEPTALSCGWGQGPMTDGKTVYAQTLPKDPKDSAVFYLYKTSSDGSKYQLFARLENSNDPDITSGLSISCGSGVCNFGLTSPNTSLTEGI